MECCRLAARKIIPADAFAFTTAIKALLTMIG
jgi:hypothetical protein